MHISYNTGKSALPDIYICMHDEQGCAAPTGKCIYIIRQSRSVCVMTNILHFWHSKNLPKLYIITDTDCDRGNLICDHISR